MKCKKCFSELDENVKFCGECGEKIIPDNNNISAKDVILFQENLKKDIDFSKPDEELTPEESAQKALYNAIDQTLEESLGDKKKDIDALRDKLDLTSNTEEGLTKLTEVGKELERNFFIQKTYLILFFEDEPENHFKVVVNGLAQKIIEDKSLTNEDRINLAKQILGLVEVYKKKILTELIAKEQIVHSLLKTFEEIIKTIDFEKYSEQTELNIQHIKTNSLKWLQLTEQLLSYRHKAIESVRERLEMENILPNMILENKGDAEAKGGKEMFFIGERMAKLINEANKGEEEIGQERDVLSEWLFGKLEDYTDLTKGDSKEEQPKESPSNFNSRKLKWGIVITLSIVALAWSVWTAIGVFTLGVIIISLIKD